jgi:hypothetical protein
VRLGGEEPKAKSKPKPSTAGAEAPACGKPGKPSRAGEAPALGRRRRRDAGIPRLTPRDVEALRWVGDQYACRLDHLQVVLGRLRSGRPITASSARAVLERWESQGLAARRSLLQGQAPWVWLTPRGLSTARLPYAPWSPSPTVRTLWRAEAVNPVRLFLEGRMTGSVWRSERALRLGQPQAAQVPAGELVDPAGSLIAVEVEAEPRSPAARAAMMRTLAGQSDALWWFASAEAWAGVHQTVCHLAPEYRALVRVYALEDV